MKDTQLYNDLLKNESLEINMCQKQGDRVESPDEKSLRAIVSIIHTIDAKDSNTSGHSAKVAKCSVELGKRMGIKEEDLFNLYYIALLHDVGKLGIPDAITVKPSSLTPEEYQIVKNHTIIGEEIIRSIDLIPGMKAGVRHHHERFDGLGYPDGLKGEAIPLSARIIGVADAYDAMGSNRSYRNGFTITEIKKEFFACREKQFDPLIVDIMLEIIDEGFHISPDELHQMAGLNTISENTVMLHNVMKTYAKEAYDNTYKDKLTKVWNRDYIKRYVDDFLVNPLNRGFLFMLDLDNFKSINDIYGHSAGDEMIIMLADTMQEVVGADGLSARIGGDEFVIFFPNEDNKDYILMIANSIIEAMKAKIERSKRGCGVSASIGIAQADLKTNSFELIFDKADKALYYVKEHGKGYSHYYNHNEMAQTVEAERMAAANINYLKKILDDGGANQGAYRVGYDGFAKIYQFISRRNERISQNGILVLYTIFDADEKAIDNSIISNAMIVLETAIVKSIRKGDVASRYSDCQQLVILLDADNGDTGRVVAKRIYDVFKHNFGKQLELKFEVSNI